MQQCRVCGSDFPTREKLRVHLRKHDLKLTGHDKLPEYKPVEPVKDPLYGTTDEVMKEVSGKTVQPPAPTERPRRVIPVTEHDARIQGLPAAVQLLYNLGVPLEELEWKPKNLPQFRVEGKRFIPSVYNHRQRHAYVFRAQHEDTTDINKLRTALREESHTLTCYVIDQYARIVKEV